MLRAHETLQAEEERLTVAQLVGDDKQDKLAAPAGAGSAAADRRHSSAELPAQNGKGDGDSLAISSGILQVPGCDQFASFVIDCNWRTWLLMLCPWPYYCWSLAWHCKNHGPSPPV